MTFERAFIAKKLSELDGYIGELTTFLEENDDLLLKDSGKIHIAERLLQLIIDTMIDINQHYIRELNFSPSEDFQSTFLTLAEHGMLPKEFARSLAPVVGLRNRIVHRYDTLDKPLFLSLLRKNLQDFSHYARAIAEHSAEKE